MTATDTVLLERRDRVAIVTFNRPDKLNALNGEIIAAFGRIVTSLKDDDSVGGIIVTGSGEKAFVAGADIAELSTMTPVTGREISQMGQRVFRALETCGKPVIAAVNGFALGGGLELAMACHLRTASKSAKFGLPETKLGIIPGYGGTVRLPRIVGSGRALEMILTAGMIDAEEAFRIGLVNRLFDPSELLNGTLALMQTIIANGPIALSLALECVDRAFERSVEDGQSCESTSFGLLSGTADMHEGMDAFLARRKAEFKRK